MTARRRLLPLCVAVVAIALLQPALTSGPRALAAGPPSHAFSTPTPGHPDVYTWQGAVLDSPLSAAAIAGTTVGTPCAQSGSAAGSGPVCEDIPLTVPQGSTSTLYVKVQWHHAAWKLHMYVISPGGTAYGLPLGCDTDTYDKGCGNETTLPFDEVTIPNPAAGVWTVRVAAVNIHNEAYSGMASLTSAAPLQYVKEGLRQLASHLTRTQRINLVFVGWKPTAQEVSDLQANLTSTFMPPVSVKQSCDGNGSNDLPVAGLVQGATSHCTGTDAATDAPATSAKPYFEPLVFNFDYHYLVADDTYTRDLFAAMKAATHPDVAYGTQHIPETTTSAPFKAAYLSKYNAQSGAFRGSANVVADTTTVDMLDSYQVEDWVQGHRLDPRYCTSFTDLHTGAVSGAQFINPDPAAVEDVAWNNNGALATPNLDRDPQGVNTGLSFLLLDTFDPSYANQYFRPAKYHTWGTFSHITDPDLGGDAGPDNGRGWGGRYRFYMLDLGAAPSVYERADWVTSTAAPDDGSAFFDPPIWQWNNDPSWNGSGVPPTGFAQQGVPYHYAGDRLGQVLGFEVTAGLSYKMIGGYLYRPIPNDVYIINTLQVVDHYSQPTTVASDSQDLYAVDMSKVYNASLGLKGLSLAAPYAYFSPAFTRNITGGCSNVRAVAGTTMNTLALNPTCSNPDPLQVSIETAKARGTAALATVGTVGGLPDGAVDQDIIRDYIDHNRSSYAPLADGAFSVPVFNVMFEKNYNVAIPGIVGGIAAGVNGGEGWGQFDNVNDLLVPAQAINCASSVPGAPGCASPVPDVFRHNYGLTYTVVHEAAHFIGLNHPHDGSMQVSKAADGTWTSYYEGLKWLYDITASPTTYAGDVMQYEDLDQDRLMYGHTAEYLKETQDWLADAVFMDAAAGRTSASPATQSREVAATEYRNLASGLFARGDYLHAQYAMKDASLYAKGVSTPQVAPHRLTLAEAANDQNAIFSIHPAAAYDSSLCSAALTGAPVTLPGQPTLLDAGGSLANTGTDVESTVAPSAVVLAGLACAAVAARRRRRDDG